MRKSNLIEAAAGNTLQKCDYEESNNRYCKESEAKYRSLVESSVDAILLTVKDGKILEANIAACEIFQMTREEICKAEKSDLMDVTDPRLAPLLEERHRTGRARGEITCKRKDGTRFQGAITSVVFTDAYGQEKTSLTIKDITDQKQAADKQTTTSVALLHALNDLNKILDSSLDIICTTDEHGTFVHVSAASESIWGYKPAELRGRRYLDFVFYEDVEITIGEAAKIKSGVPVTMFENRYIHKDGSVVPLIWSSRWDEKDKLMYCIAKDATEKKNLEKACEIEKKHFHDLYLQSPSCMGTLKGPNHVFEMANPLYLQLIDKKDIIGKTVKEVLPELEAQGIFDFLDTVYKTGQTFSANEMLVKFDLHGNGKLVDTYLNFIYQAHRDHEGQIDGILFFAIDATEQVLSRRKIEESEKRYRQIVETTLEGIWLIDENNKTTFVNPKMSGMLEYSIDEMLGKEIYFFMDDQGKKIAAELIKKKRERYTDERHFKFISKSGKEIWTNISANPLFNEDGSYQGCLAMITDITERKKNEKKLAKAQSIAQLGNWAIDMADDSHIWSDELYNLFGISKQEVIPGAALFLSFIHPDDLDYAKERIEEVNTTLLNSSFEFRFIREDGNLRYGFSEWQFEFDINRKPTWLIGIVQDVTERKLGEIERIKIISDLVQRNNDLEQFAYIVSHNLRAPVANILGIENLLNDPGLSNEDIAILRQGLRQSVTGLDSIVKDMSQILHVKLKNNENKEMVHFSVLVEDIKISLKILIDREKIKIDCDFAEINELLSLKSYMYSIFYALISNSIKYRQKQISSVIKIKSRRLKGKIELIFSDNGMGIDLQKQGDQVFGLYKRFHLNIEGKGMGLFMVKKQVETLGGKISIKSQVNKGTEFKIKFDL